jgi:acetolactate synthase-1/2/3 large subunit
VQKYSDYFMNSLKEMGYTTCFYVGGGNSMHLLESASKLFRCVPVVHEVTAAIASEYFNQARIDGERAFALVTAGPGLTNLVTGIAGAWLDSRELLVVGGQAKSTNLAEGKIRQIGHQEIDGVGIVDGITKLAKTIKSPLSSSVLEEMVSQSWTGRPGPVFIEVCLDVSAMAVDEVVLSKQDGQVLSSARQGANLGEVTKWRPAFERMLKSSSRPLLLLGGGVSREMARRVQDSLAQWKFPIACTWTGADRCGFDYPYFAGRPNTYGMRWANIFQQQSDLLIAVGTSLGYQQTGFNVEDYMPVGKIVHVDLDRNELEKSNPRPRFGIHADSDTFLIELMGLCESFKVHYDEWSGFLNDVKESVPTLEECQSSSAPFISPHTAISYVSTVADPNDRVVAASSGGTFTATLQTYVNQRNQLLLGNKGLASMGYGLAGAIGLAIHDHKSRTILFEGDGGFAQNMQDLGTVVANDLNVKIFITCNDGYASIRTSQKNYFNGNYLGCDTRTGLQLPNWELLFDAFGIPHMTLGADDLHSKEFDLLWQTSKAAAFLILADPEQMYLPKIFSRVATDGSMQSTALHDMSPALSAALSKRVFKYLPPDLVPSSE